jgi:hypothetical protein
MLISPWVAGCDKSTGDSFYHWPWLLEHGRRREESVRLISHQDGLTATWALTRALIEGVQPKHGWWAPVAQCHK